MSDEKPSKEDVLERVSEDATPKEIAHKSIGAEKHFCPNCKEWYEPKYDSKQEAKQHNDSIGAEQYITGICTDECWDEFLGVPTSITDDLRKD